MKKGDLVRHLRTGKIGVVTDTSTGMIIVSCYPSNQVFNKDEWEVLNESR